MLKGPVILMAAMLLVAGPAAADEARGIYDRLSPGGRAHVDALYEAQFDARRPPRGRDRLTRDDIAAARADGGWGKIFKQFQRQGYYPDARNFGQIVSRYRNEQNRLRHAPPGARHRHSSQVVITTGSGHRTGYRTGPRKDGYGDRDGGFRTHAERRHDHRDSGPHRVRHGRGGDGGSARGSRAGSGIVSGRGGALGVASGAPASVGVGRGHKNGAARGRKGGRRK